MDFRILCNGDGRKKFELEGDRLYKIPEGATHIHLYAGKICFGVCSYNGSRITRRGKFFRIPKKLPGGAEIKATSFPGFYRGKSGFNYGEPEFFGPPIARFKL